MVMPLGRISRMEARPRRLPKRPISPDDGDQALSGPFGGRAAARGAAAPVRRAGRCDRAWAAARRRAGRLRDRPGSLDAPLDVFVVRKLGVPGHEELALGAIATGGTRVLNRQVVDSLAIPPELVEAVDAREMQELQRRETRLPGRPATPGARRAHRDPGGRRPRHRLDDVGGGARAPAGGRGRSWSPCPSPTRMLRGAARRGRRGRVPHDAASLPGRRALVRRLLADHRRGGSGSARARASPAGDGRSRGATALGKRIRLRLVARAGHRRAFRPHRRGLARNPRVLP